MKPSVLKNSILLLTLTCIFALDIQAQSGCPGLKNPTMFTPAYSGRIGGIQGYNPTGSMFTEGRIVWDTIIGNKGIIGSGSLTIQQSTVKDGPYGGSENIKQRGHPGAQFKNRFEIVGEGMPINGMDGNTCGRLSMTPPDTSFKRSIRIGNSMNSEVEELYYTMDVDASNCFLTFWYAIVMEWPRPDHEDKNPKIQIEVQRESEYGKEDWTLYKTCLEYEMLAGQDAVDQWGTKECEAVGGDADQPVIYKDWAPVVINLYDNAIFGERVRIRFYNQDCLATGHYSYMYLAGDCGSKEIVTNSCAAQGNDTVGYLEAPAYLNNYQWYAGIYDLTQPNGGGRAISRGMGGQDSILYILQDAFDGEITLNYYCTFDSYLNPTKACPDYIETEISNTKPRILIDSKPLCDRWVEFTNRSDIPARTITSVDTLSVAWEIEGTTYYGFNGDHGYYTPIRHQFSTAGRHQITLSVSNTVTPEACSNTKVFYVDVRDSLAVDFTTDKINYCIGDVATFSVKNPEAYSYTWSSRGFMATGSEIHPSLTLKDTVVTLVARTAECRNEITKRISIEPYPNLTVTGDRLICYGDSTTLSADVSNIDQLTVKSYEWSTSPSGNPSLSKGDTYTATPDNTTTYYIIVTTENDCRTPSNLEVEVLRPLITADTTEICPGGVVTLTATGLDKAVTEYTWRSVPAMVLTPTGTKNNTLVVSPNETTDYYLTANSTMGCIPLESTQRVAVYPYPVPEIYVTPNFIDVEEPVLSLSDESLHGVTSFWNLGDGNTSTKRDFIYRYSEKILSEDSVTISLISYNELLCDGKTSVKIPIDPLLIRFPNAFAPGKDNNHVFVPYTESIFKEYHLYIYNRWGELVFETTDVTEGWDGTFNGKDCIGGGYVWVVNFTRPAKSRVYSMKGSVLLIR